MKEQHGGSPATTGPIGDQRHLFDLPREIAWLNCAYMSPLPRSARQAGEAAIRRKSEPWTISPVDFFTDSEEARGLFGRLIGAAGDDVAVVPSTSYGIATAARNIRVAPGQTIVLMEEQFPSNVFSWRRKAEEESAEVLTARRPSDGDWAAAICDLIDDRTAVVAVPNCHWSDGSLVDLDRVAEKGRRHGAALVLDLAQSIGALPVDVAALKPDYVVAACYKWMLGPYSLGFLYVAPHRQGGVPLEENWLTRAGSENFAGLADYSPDYQPGARRFDMGERSNFHLMPMALASLRQILDWQVPRIAQAIGEKTRAIAERAEPLGFEAPPQAARAPHFLGLRLPGGVPATLLDRLKERNVFVSVRGSSVRVTPHLYNDGEDVERLFEALKAAL